MSKGEQFPTFFKRKDSSVSVDIQIAKGELGRASFLTDVRNEYFSRKKNSGKETFTGDIIPTSHLYNGRYTLTFAPDKNLCVGTALASHVVITDNKGSGPFTLGVNIIIAEPADKKEPGSSRPTSPPKTAAGPSRPDIQEVHEGPESPPLTIQPVPDSERLKLLLNVDTKLLEQAKAMRPKEEEVAVEFVFKYGLALAAMGLLDSVKRTDDWKANQAECRKRIEETAAGIARVIVPLCLSLPKKLPKSKLAAA